MSLFASLPAQVAEFAPARARMRQFTESQTRTSSACDQQPRIGRQLQIALSNGEHEFSSWCRHSRGAARGSRARLEQQGTTPDDHAQHQSPRADRRRGRARRVGRCAPFAPWRSADAPIVIKFGHVVAPDTATRQSRRAQQAARRGAHQGPREGRGLPEQPALQGQGRTRGAAARLGADAGAVAGQVRPAGGEGVRSVRSALHLQGHAVVPRRHRRAGRRRPVQEARAQGHHGASPAQGQRLRHHERQPATAPSGRLQGPEDAHPELEGAGRQHALTGRHPAGDGLQRAVPGAAVGRHRRLREHAVQRCTRRRSPRVAEGHRPCPTTATSRTRSSSTRSSGTACPPTSARRSTAA